MNRNDYNEEKCYGVSTDFIRKWKDLFFITICEKASTNIPLSKMYRLRKGATLIHLYWPMYLDFDDNPPYYYKNVSFLRHTLTETWDVIIDVPITLHIMIWLLRYLKVLGEFYFLNFWSWKIIPCPKKIICNNCEQNHMLGDILNSGDNVDD